MWHCYNRTRSSLVNCVNCGFSSTPDSGSNDGAPLGYFLPLDLAPFRRGFFFGRDKKRAGPLPCSTYATLAPAFCFSLPAGASRRLKGSPSHDLDRSAQPVQVKTVGCA